MPAGLTRRASSAKQGLEPRSPAMPMLHHLLAAVLFSQRRDSARPAPTSRPASPERPDNAAAQLLAARIARAGEGFRRRAVASRSGDRDRAAARGLSRKGAHAGPGRPQAAGARGLAGHSEQSFPTYRKPRRGSDGWHGRTAIMPAPRPCWNARRQATRRHRSGSISASSRQDLRDHEAPPRAYRKALETKAGLCRSRAQSRHGAAGASAISTARCAPIAQAYRLRPSDLRHHRDGADLGAARPAVAGRGKRCAVHSAA